ncbi:MAG: helix-turn-helix domain-containing protein [Mobilitalea sp.]
MDNKKIGDFITSLRKNKNMTQRDLADQLGVTDKAVSKWERGAGYPDIAMLKPLADALGTSVNELLEGEASKDASDTKNDVTNALDYADKIITIKENKIGKILAVILTISLFIAVFTSIIVNIAVNHRLSWSILVIAGCTMGGCLLLPFLVVRKRGLFYSLCLLTLIIMPFLAVIQTVTSDYSLTSGWLWSLGFPISVTWLTFTWFMIFLYKKMKISLWFYTCIGALLCIPGHIITNYVVDLFTNNLDFNYSRQITYVSSILGFLAAAGICLVVGFLRKKPKVGAK